MAVPMTPPQKPEGPLQPVDTSSQASAEAAEASLEDIPPASPQLLPFPGPEVLLPSGCNGALGNANKALEDLLTTKASIDAHRQRAIWELGIVLC